MKTGTIVRVDSRVSHVEVDGAVHLCSVRGRHFEAEPGQRCPTVVGDRVDVDLSTRPGVIERIHPRRSWFSRAATRSGKAREQVLVANVDQVVAVASCRQPRFSSTFVDRVLCAVEANDLAGVICLNKTDLAGEGFVEEVCATYAPLGYRVVPTSCVSEAGLEELAACLHGRISVLSGLSGVGKSTLLNRLDPALDLVTGEVSRKWSSGRHTTTFSQLLKLPCSGYVVDTPGRRKFNLVHFDRRTLGQLFVEFQTFAPACAFHNCLHLEEPDCAVLAALAAGEIAPSRYQSYRAILEDP